MFTMLMLGYYDIGMVPVWMVPVAVPDLWISVVSGILHKLFDLIADPVVWSTRSYPEKKLKGSCLF